MAHLASIKQISKRFASTATFVTVYTQEAHPDEKGEFIDYFLPIQGHKTATERLEAAGNLSRLEELPGPLLVDNMADEASRWYGSFPDRLYIVLDKKIVYQGGPGPHGYRPVEVENWLEKYSKSS